MNLGFTGTIVFGPVTINSDSQPPGIDNASRQRANTGALRVAGAAAPDCDTLPLFRLDYTSECTPDLATWPTFKPVSETFDDGKPVQTILAVTLPPALPTEGKRFHRVKVSGQWITSRISYARTLTPKPWGIANRTGSRSPWHQRTASSPRI